MIRVLYIDIDLVNLNPSATYFPLLIEATNLNIDYYGLGFSSQEILSKGLAHWVVENGPYHVLVIGPNSPALSIDLDHAISSTLTHLHRSSANNHSDLQVVEFIRDFLYAIPRIKIPHRLISSINFDYYAATKAQVNRLYDWGLNLIGPNDQFVSPLADLPAFAKMEKHYLD